MLKNIFAAFKAAPTISPHIKVTSEGSAALIMIDRPAALNAINSEMYKTLYYVLKNLENKKDIIVVKGVGDKAFSAGGDIREVVKLKDKEIFWYTYKSYDLVASFKKPYISIMNGITMGGGSPFSIAGKYKIATEKTMFAMPETGIGHFNDAGSSYFLSRLNNNIGLYLGLTGTKLQGYDVKKVGLASHFIDSYKLEDLEKQLMISKSHDDVVKCLKKFSSDPQKTETKLDLIVPFIDKCFDGETVEEIYENLHLNGSDWAMETIRTLNEKSPTSLKVSHHMIKAGKELSLRECLSKEYEVCVRYFDSTDLQEGVRALLIEKDFKPNWNPKKIQDVNEVILSKFLKPLPDSDKLKFETR